MSTTLTSIERQNASAKRHRLDTNMGTCGMAVTHLLYLHGFRSSPQSNKARQVAARVAQRHPRVTWWCPQLPPSPKAAIDMVMQGTAAWPRPHMAVMGSSLGGF